MLYTSSKDEKGKWSKLKAFPYNGKDYSTGHPTLSSDGKTLYFASDMPGGMGGLDIYKTTYSNGEWSKPENLGSEINTSKMKHSRLLMIMESFSLHQMGMLGWAAGYFQGFCRYEVCGKYGLPHQYKCG